MSSVREILEPSSQLHGFNMPASLNEDSPKALGPAMWDWGLVKSVLVVRLRSIGDTVLSTPSLFALKRFLPQARIDVLLEDWVAPVLDGFEYVDNVITLKAKNTSARAIVARKLRATQYDVVYNLHGGTTATLLTRFSGARHRVGFATYQYARLHQHLAPSSSLLWGREKTHSVEQQLALLGWSGVPVTDRPPSHLAVTTQADATVTARLQEKGISDGNKLALVHPAAAFATKQWAAEKFARVIDALSARGLKPVVITTEKEAATAAEVERESKTPVTTFLNLSLPEVTALAARSRLFVGNDSGIAHIAAAVSTPSVVIFGSSNVDHWRPWAQAPATIVREELECQPCHGYFCEKFPQPECILRVPTDRVVAAIDQVMQESA